MKNNAKNIKEITLESGFNIVMIHNESARNFELLRPCHADTLQIHFMLTETGKLLFNRGAYTIDIPEKTSLLLYNPQRDLPIHLQLKPEARYLGLLISIQKFHSFFTSEADLIHFLNEENRNKKFYDSKSLTPNEQIVIKQLFEFGIHASLESLYIKGKIFELLSLYFNKAGESDQKCPFLEDEENVEKVRKAKDILINRMTDPPRLTELAQMVHLSEQHLKDGFKQIYGETAYAFLLNYKMEYARNLLISRKYNVAETSFELGYSTPSHFISAFKKKFGVTPKKYLGSL